MKVHSALVTDNWKSATMHVNKQQTRFVDWAIADHSASLTGQDSTACLQGQLKLATPENILLMLMYVLLAGTFGIFLL